MERTIVTLLKIAIPLAVLSLLTWIVVYSRLQPWWKDQIGVTLVTKSSLVIGQLILLGLTVFVRFGAEGSAIVGWLYVIFTFMITPIMIWRTVVWVRASQEDRVTLPVKSEER